MQARRNFLPIFFVFFLLAIAVFFLSKISFLSGLGVLGSPLPFVEGGFFQIVHMPSVIFTDKKYQALQEENVALQNRLVQLQEVEKDNTALRDQFATSSIPSTSLLPATIIGAPQFFPGITHPEMLTINKGDIDGVKSGQSVVYKNNCIGVVGAVGRHIASVVLVSNTSTSFTVHTLSTNAQGVLAGQGNGAMTLGSVVLSDHLQVGDVVVSSGSQDLSGKGIPPGLIVGKIASVNKNPSSLYQTARVDSLLPIEKLTTIFVLL